MNLKVKTAFIIIITLALGIVIGAMLNRALLQNRIRRAFSMQRPGFFVPIYENIIDPDSNQSKLIREILDKHARRMSEVRESYRKEMQSAFESMRKEMDPILTREQKKRLENRLPRSLRRHRRFRNQQRPFMDQRKKNLSKEQKNKRRF